MTVRDLINRLREYPPDAIVVMSSDAEGNTFSPLDDEMAVGLYRPQTSWNGQFRATDDESTRDDAVGAVALWPLA
jgi:hypothetical protein